MGFSDQELIERLRSQAQTASDITRQMMEAKSLRQYDNPEGRTDLYEWPTPEQTLEGQAADRIAALSPPQSITPPEGGELERVARAICGKDDPDELVAAGNPLGEYAEYPRWMLFQLDAKKIISDPRSGLEELATWFRFDATNGEFTGEYCSVKPHDAHGMEPMVHINYALAIAALSTPEASDTKLVDALIEAETTLALAEEPPIADPYILVEVRKLGDRVGYGNLMSTASEIWRSKLEPSGGEFVAGPCRTTVIKALTMIREALAQHRGSTL